MILVDTSIWIDHLRHSEPDLVRLLNEGSVLVHPFVIGELALGNLKNRNAILEALMGLPASITATDEDVLSFINHNDLAGCGIGYVDVHLLAATRLTSGCTLWTRDKRQHAASIRLKLAAKLQH